MARNIEIKARVEDLAALERRASALPVSVLREDEPQAQGETLARELLTTLGVDESSSVSGAYIDLLT